MVIGMLIVLTYTTLGGMLSVAILDFVQMIVIISGLLFIAYTTASLTEGITPVIEHAAKNQKLNFWPKGDIWIWISFFATGITMMLGSIPQQDVFQRVTSAKTAKIALWGSIMGALIYFLFTFVPMFIAYSATIINPELFADMVHADAQHVLPKFVMQYMSKFEQIIFFGAVMSAIMSCSAATLLAPSVTFAENVIKVFNPSMSDKELFKAMRICVVAFAMLVLAYALSSNLSIFGMVESAYKITLAGAFTPLVFGIFWSKANQHGALAALVGGISSWILFEFFINSSLVPAQLIGLLVSMFLMILVSSLTQRSSALAD